MTPEKKVARAAHKTALARQELHQAIRQVRSKMSA